MSLTDFDRACEDLISGVHLCIGHAGEERHSIDGRRERRRGVHIPIPA